MYDFNKMIEETIPEIPDRMQVYKQMEDQTKRAVAIASGSESGPYSEFGSIISDMISHYNQYMDFLKNGNQQIHLSIQMYLYLVKFCQLNKINHVADIGCGWNPMQSFYFGSQNIDYIGVDYPSTQSTLVQMLNTPYYGHIQYVSSEYPYTNIDFPEEAVTLGMFLYSMNNLVDCRKYPMVGKDQISSTQLAICNDFDVVAFTVFDGFDENTFRASTLAKTHKIIHISKSFEWSEEFSGKDTKLVLLTKRDSDSGLNYFNVVSPDETYWVEDKKQRRK